MSLEKFVSEVTNKLLEAEEEKDFQLYPVFKFFVADNKLDKVTLIPQDRFHNTYKGWYYEYSDIINEPNKMIEKAVNDFLGFAITQPLE